MWKRVPTVQTRYTGNRPIAPIAKLGTLVVLSVITNPSASSA